MLALKIIGGIAAVVIGIPSVNAYASDPEVDKIVARNHALVERASKQRASDAKCEIKIGMSIDALHACHGMPYNINITTTATHVYKQWVYGNTYQSKTYYYFVDGYLTSYQTIQ